MSLTVLPEGLTLAVEPGVSVLEACREHDIDLPGICGGRGRCRECRVTVIGREVAPSALDQSLLEPEDLARGWRLSCQLTVDGDLTVELPPVSLKLLDPSVVLPQLASVEPVIQDVEVDLPAGESDRPAIALLEDALLEKGIRVQRRSIAALRELGLALARRDYRVRCLLHQGTLLDVRSRSSSPVYGLAIDIGTSTVSIALLDLKALAMLSVETARNPQGAYGGDFMSRIAFAMEKEENLLELHGKIIGSINRTIERLLMSYGIARNDIVLVTVAGNAVMHHLFFGLDVKTLGGFPFRPVVNELMAVPAAELALKLAPATPVVGLPLISGYIGADTVGVVVALDLLNRTDTVIAVDVGTNAEVALVHRGKLYVCSAPAGPAFEGAQMACGTQARPGAITKIAIDDERRELRIATVEEKPPFGIAGTGIVDAVAELARVGVLDDSGRMLETEEWPAWLRGRAHLAGEMKAFIFARDPEDRPLYVHQGDVRELQLAKAATATAIHYVMSAASVTAAELDRVYVAGAFGSYLDPVSMLRIALLPDVPRERVEFIGNAALAGAVLATLSRRHLESAVRVAQEAVRVDMATDESFQDVFVDKLRLAH
ncbi:MAG TPA: ASKHA domain-containing protein [Burkholderiales bacterium]|nr:ASKHA domain-containing protein [Burkholderiales bacterium]